MTVVAGGRRAGRYGRRFYLTTALVGAGLCLMQVPAMATELLLHDDVVLDQAVIDWNTSNANQVWRTVGNADARAFDDDDIILLRAFVDNPQLTLRATGTVRPQAIVVGASDYAITGTSSGLLRGYQSGFINRALTFSFEGADNSLTVDAAMAGQILIGRAAGAVGSGGRLVYGGDSTTARIRVVDGTTLEVTGSLAATDTGTSGFRLGSNSTLAIATGGTATGTVERDGLVSTDTALRVDGELNGGVSGLGSVRVGAGGVITGVVETGNAGTVALTGTGGSVATVGQVAGIGTVTIEGDTTATGSDGKGADIGTSGVFHAVNGGGTFATAGEFISAGTLGSANAADGVTGITAGVIRLTGGAVLGDVAFDGALEVGNLGLAGVVLDGNDILRGTLAVLADGQVTIGDNPAGFDANAAAITVAAGGNLIASGNVSNVVTLESAGGLHVAADRTMSAGTVLLTGGDAVINGTLASGAAVALQGGTLTVSGTGAVQGAVNATGGLLKLAGTVTGDVTLTTDAELAGSIGNLLLDVPGGPPAPPYQVVTTGDLSAISVLQRAGVFTIAAGTTLTSPASIRVEGGQLVVQGTTGALNVTQAGSLLLEGGTTGTLINRGEVQLHGSMASLDNRGLGRAIIDGVLAILDAGTVSNEGVLTIVNAGMLDMTGTLDNAGTLVLNGGAGAIANTGTVLVESTGDGSAAAIANTGTLTVSVGGRLTVTGGLDNADGTAAIAGELAGNLAGGSVIIADSGKVSGDVTASGMVESLGEITGTLAVSGTAEVSGRVGTLHGLGGGTVTMTDAGGAGTDLKLASLQNDGAAMTVASGAGVVVTGSAANAAGSLTLHGDLDVTGTATGRLDNAGTLSVAGGGSLTGDLHQTGGGTTIAAGGTITGDADMQDGSLTVSGTVDGDLRQTGGTTTIATGGTITGNADMQGGSLTVNGTLDGNLVQGGAGTLTTIEAGGGLGGNVLVSGGQLISRGTITGNLVNNADARLSGTVSGTLSGTGATITGGNLALGGLLLTGSGGLTVDDGHVLTLNSVGVLQGNAQLHVDGGTLVGDVSLAVAGTGLTLGNGGMLSGTVTSHGTVTVAGQATLTGVLENRGLVSGGAGLVNVLSITGDLSNYGAINASAGGALVVNVSGYYENFGGSLGAGVTILGNIRNSKNWLIDADVRLDAGNLLNAATGIITLDAGLSMAGHNLTNAGLITVNGTGSISDVEVLTNQNALTVLAGGSITAGHIVNDGGSVANAGLLTGAVENRSGSFTSTGALVGTFTNTGTATLSGSAAAVVNGNGGVMQVPAAGALVAGVVRNGAGGQMTVSGTLTSDDLRNEAGGLFTGTGALIGNFHNEGTAILSGTAGTVVNAGGTMSLGGDLAVAALTNRAGLAVGTGRTLTVAGAMLNDTTGAMTVAGSVAGGVDNAGSLTVTTTGTVAEVVNRTGGTLVLRGIVTGLLGNLAGGSVEVTGPGARAGAVDNRGHLRVGAAGHLSVAANIVNSGTMLVTGAVTAATLRNEGGSLTSRGSLTAQVVNAGTAQLSGTITGRLDNLSGIATITNTLVMSGPITVQGGTVLVKGGATLNAGVDPVTVTGAGRLSVSGRLEGDVVNAGTLVAGAGSRIAGMVVNLGSAQLAGHVDELDNRAGASTFVHGDLTVDLLASQGQLTVAAGRALTVGNGVLGGHTVIAGSLSGPVENQGHLVARGLVSGLHNAAGGRLDLAGGTLDAVVNDGEIQVTRAAGIGADGLVNNAVLRLMGSADLTIGSLLHNAAGGEMILAQAARATGPIVNDGLLTSRGTLAGGLQNNGTARLGGTVAEVVNDGVLQSLGTLAVGNLTNNGTLRVAAGTVLESDNVLVTAAGGTTQVNGTLRAQMLVESGGLLVSTGRVLDTLAVEGEARLAGRAANVLTEAGGMLRVTGNLDMLALSNRGETVIQAGATVTPGIVVNLAAASLTVQAGAEARSDVLSDGLLRIAGRVTGDIDNAGRMIGQGGSVSGNVVLRPSGVITGDLNIEGQLIIGLARPALTVVMQRAMLLGGPPDPDSEIEAGAVVVLTDGAHVQEEGSLLVRGTLIADAVNAGWLNIDLPGKVQGNVWTSGDFTLAGMVTGHVTFAGGDMNLAPGGIISGDLVLAADHAFASGGQVNAARLVVAPGAELSLAGAGPGTLVVNGGLVNDGAVGLANGTVGDLLTVSGALSGDGIYRLDTHMALGTADRVDVTGGPVSGHLAFDLRDVGVGAPDFGQVATLLSWDTAFTAQNSYQLAHPVGLPEANERVIYLVVSDDAAGEIQLISAANPAVGAISGNIVLTQSLIGTVINRPSSPYTTGIGFEADRACRVGSWARAVGGTADATGATRGAELPNRNRISVESRIDASYHGFQVGTDLGCYDGRFAEWTLIGGAIMGLNSGSTTQPVYAVDPLTGRATAEMTSVNEADFDQKYVGLYLSAMKGSWVVDLQVRREWTAFKLNNTPQPGSLGLRLTDAAFDSRATTVSGSVGYSLPLGGEDSGWSLTPTAGFAWTRTSTDTIVFDDDSMLALNDSETRIGFVGAGLSRTRLAGDGRSAMSLFASGTWYKDFSGTTESIFTLVQTGSTSVQPLSSDNLGSFGEISLGASYVRLMEGGGPFKQLNATVRVDGRSGSALDSYGITGQLRLQF